MSTQVGIIHYTQWEHERALKSFCGRRNFALELLYDQVAVILSWQWRDNTSWESFPCHSILSIFCSKYICDDDNDQQVGWLVQGQTRFSSALAWIYCHLFNFIHFRSSSLHGIVILVLMNFNLIRTQHSSLSTSSVMVQSGRATTVGRRVKIVKRRQNVANWMLFI